MLTITECVICKKPLGAESRDLGFPTCIEHRACHKCGKHLSAAELKWCHSRALEDGAELTTEGLIHPRCELSESHTIQDATLSIKQSEYTFLNLLRLKCIPNPDLSDDTNISNAALACENLITRMDFEAQRVHLLMMESALEVVQRHLRNNREELKTKFQESEKEKIKQAKREALTSARPTSKKADSPEEQSLALFMETHGLTDRKVALTIWKKRENGIQQMLKLFPKMNESTVRDSVTADMVKNGLLPK